MSTTEPREINQTIKDARNRGRNVYCSAPGGLQVGRIINARKQKGRLQVRSLSSGKWETITMAFLDIR